MTNYLVCRMSVFINVKHIVVGNQYRHYTAF